MDFAQSDSVSDEMNVKDLCESSKAIYAHMQLLIYVTGRAAQEKVILYGSSTVRSVHYDYNNSVSM